MGPSGELAQGGGGPGPSLGLLAGVVVNVAEGAGVTLKEGTRGWWVRSLSPG